MKFTYSCSTEKSTTKSRNSYIETAGIVFTAQYYDDNSENILKGYNYSCLHLLFVPTAVETSTLYFRNYNVILPRLIFFLSFLAFANVLVTLQQSLPSTNPGYDILSWKILPCRETYKRHWQWRTQPKWHSMIICGETKCCLFFRVFAFYFSQNKPWTFWGLELKVGRLINLVLSVACCSTYHVLFFKKL